MVKQDPRVMADERQLMFFFEYISKNYHEPLRDLLRENPTLVFAVDERGYPPLRIAVSCECEESYHTAEILISFGADPKQKNNPEGIQSDGSWGDTHTLEYLRLHNDFLRKFAKLFIPEIKFDEYDSTIRYGHRQYRDLEVVNNAVEIIRKNENPQSSCIICSVHEVTYEQELNIIFKNQLPFGLEEEKKLNQMTHELFSSSEFMSFAPVAFSFSSSDLSIVVIPKELAEFSLEQIKGFIGMIYSYFSDT